MDELDDVIGLLNSNKQRKEKAANPFLPSSSPQTAYSSQPMDKAEDQKEIADRRLNIERLMEELETMKAKK